MDIKDNNIDKLPLYLDDFMLGDIENCRKIMRQFGHYLHYACVMDDFEEIKRLIDIGANINEVVLGQTPLSLYLCIGHSSTKVVQMFLNRQELELQNLDYQYESIPAMATES